MPNCSPSSRTFHCAGAPRSRPPRSAQAQASQQPAPSAGKPNILVNFGDDVGISPRLKKKPRRSGVVDEWAISDEACCSDTRFCGPRRLATRHTGSHRYRRQDRPHAPEFRRLRDERLRVPISPRGQRRAGWNRQAARREPRACVDPLWSRTTPSSRRLLSERIPYAVKQARGGERSHRHQEGGNEVMQHVAGDVAERGPEHGRPGHARYLSGGGAESSRSQHATRTILRRVVPSVAAPGPCRLAECSGTTHSPSPRLPRFVPAHAANFRCTPSRSDARRNRARA
jgi:hypothetical protein